MLTFWIFAALMLAAATTLLVGPMLRAATRTDTPIPAGPAALLIALGLPAFAVLIYLNLSDWSWDRPAHPTLASGEAATMSELVGTLRSLTQNEPDNADHWLNLGRALMAAGDAQASLEPFDRAFFLSGKRDPQIALFYAEALVTADSEALAGRGGDLVETALALAPTDRKALWYGGQVAFVRGDYATAAQRWQALYDHTRGDDSESAVAVRQLLSEQLDMLRAHADGDLPASATARTDPADVPEGIPLQISLHASLADQVTEAAPLFIIARPSGQQGGPPLAVIRRSSAELPLQVTLTDADAMMPGASVTGAGDLQIVARISLSGAPTARQGDPYGQSTYTRGAADAVQVLIDQVAR